MPFVLISKEVAVDVPVDVVGGACACACRMTLLTSVTTTVVGVVVHQQQQQYRRYRFLPFFRSSAVLISVIVASCSNCC